MNYHNAAGELVKDVDEHIVTGAGPTYGDGIEWTTTGKVKKMHFNNGKYGVKFIYDALDRRIAKQVYKETSGTVMLDDLKKIANGEMEPTMTHRRFMMHELTEKRLIEKGLKYDDAHYKSNKKWVTNETEVYTPEANQAWDEQLMKEF